LQGQPRAKREKETKAKKGWGVAQTPILPPPKKKKKKKKK
jgi:hypothetical protein